MKIMILPDAFCVGVWQSGSIKIGKCCVKDCNIEWNLESHLQGGLLPCLTKQISINQPFFCNISKYNQRVRTCNSFCVSHFVREGDNLALVPGYQTGGDRLRLTDGDSVLVNSHKPKDFSFLPNHSCSILTSDALLVLEKESFIGFKNGHIDILGPEEVLEQLSSHVARNSPSFEQVHVEPTSSRPRTPRRGTLIFNKLTSTLELFNGESWKTVQTES